MSKNIINLTVFSIAFLLGLTSCDKAPERIVILHHNDFHAANSPFEYNYSTGREPYYEEITSTTDVAPETVQKPNKKAQVQGAAGLKGLAEAVRDTVPNSLWLDAGDDFTGAPISSITQGASQIAINRKIGIDAAVIGNHEFDYGRERARAYVDSMGIPVVGGANLMDENGNPFALEYYDTTLANTPVRIIGLVPPNLHALTMASATGQLNIPAPEEAVKKFLPESGVLTVVLSHMGYYEDVALAKKVPEIDVIVGGHQHAVLIKPRLIRPDSAAIMKSSYGDGKSPVMGTVVVQAGERGAYLGYLSLMVKKGDVVSYNGRLLPNDGGLAAPDPDFTLFISDIESSLTQTMDEVIAQLPKPLNRSRWGQGSALGRWETDAFRQVTGADIAFQNPGGLRKDLSAGDLTIRDLWEANPFGNTLVLFDITGAELQKAWEHIAFSDHEPLLVSGMSLTLDRNNNEIRDIRVQGEPLSPDKKYKAATNSYVFGHFQKFFGFPQGDRWHYDTGMVDREKLIEVAKAQKVISDPGNVRVTVVD